MCKCCGEKIRDNGPPPQTNNFNDVGNEISRPAPWRRYDHVNEAKARKSCASYFTRMPSGKMLADHAFDFRVVEANRAGVLSQDNDIVLRRLIFSLTQRDVSDQELSKLNADAFMRMGAMQIFTQHSWLWPFMVARNQHCVRSSENGPMFTYMYMIGKEQGLSYQNISGQHVTERVPQQMNLFKSRWRKAMSQVLNPSTGRYVVFDVSEASHERILGEQRRFSGRQQTWGSRRFGADDLGIA